MIFTLDNIDMETIQSNPHKFLGSQITFSGKQSEIYSQVSNHILIRLERIDSLQVSGEYKARIYKNYLLPANRFILTVHELTNRNNWKPNAQIFTSRGVTTLRHPWCAAYYTIYRYSNHTFSVPTITCHSPCLLSH